jgi:hypothetical protein
MTGLTYSPAEFLKLSDREILTHAGRVSLDVALAKAELEYNRFAVARAALPAPVEMHFEEAARDVKQFDKAQRAEPTGNAPKRRKKRP